MVLVLHGNASARSFANEVQERLRVRLEAQESSAWRVGHEWLFTQTATPAFYLRRTFEPAWLDGRCPAPIAQTLRDTIADAQSHGLVPEHYHLTEIDKHLNNARNCRTSGWSSAAAMELELLLTDAFLLYTSHLVGGRVDPANLDPEWHARKREVDLVALLENVISGKLAIPTALKEVLPLDSEYDQLRRALATYRKIAQAGGWPVLPDSTELKPGDTGERLALLHRRLIAEGYISGNPGGSFDATTEAAVRAFQSRLGLKITGIIDAVTLAELNVSATARARQIEFSLERWRWLPRVLGDRHVFINIPEFALRAIDKERIVLEMKSIVGRPYRRSPMLSSTIKYLVFSPTWTVPPTILRQDLLPRMKKERDFFRKSGMVLYQGWGADAQPVDPASVNWSKISANNFRYRLVQKPGRTNALGRIKFMFPNPFGVYIHDTPTRDLFGEGERAFSSGCIRIEDPLELAAWLLHGAKGWSPARIENESRRRKEHTVRLPKPVDIHLAYLTAWVDDQGGVHFRRDIYQRDDRLDRALNRRPPTPQ